VLDTRSSIRTVPVMTTPGSYTTLTAARAATNRAHITWADTLFATFEMIADNLNVTGEKRAVLVHVDIDMDSCEHEHWREEISRIEFCGLERDVGLQAAQPSGAAVTFRRTRDPAAAA
jgi:hypothetical protein